MDHHILFDKTKHFRMTGRMILNKIMGSRKRLVLSLVLAVVFVDLCILTMPRASRSHRVTLSSAGPSEPDRPADGDEASHGRRARRFPRRPHQGRDQESSETDWEPTLLPHGVNDDWDRLNEVDVDGGETDVLKPVEARQADPPGPQPPRRSLEIQSGEETVEMKLDGHPLLVPETNNRTRGLHVVVLHQTTGTVMARRRFDMVLAEVHQEVIRFLDAVRPGRIIVMATKDDMSFKMHSDLRYKLTQLGSQFIPELGFRDQWAMVSIQGVGEALGESFSPAPEKGEYGGPLFLRVDLVVGSLPDTAGCQWPESEENRRRRAFCDNYEGYPGVCRCLQPHQILPEPTSLDEDIDPIYVAVMATHRPYYLYRSLRSLAFAQGTQPANIIVYLENDLNPELEALVSLFDFQIRYVAAKSSAKIGMVIGNRVIDIMNDVFTTYMEAEYTLLLEEDLECSPDIFRYFGQTHSLLQDDPSVFSISAFNVQSHSNTSGATDVAYRVEGFSGVAFLMARNVFEKEVKPIWPKYAWKSDWDIFLDKLVRGDRESIWPDVNRVYHLGRDSHYIHSDMYDNISKNLSVNPDPTSSLKDVTRLHKLNYEEDLKSKLSGGNIAREYTHICNVANFTTGFLGQNRTEILFFKMDYAKDISTWSHLAQCWGLWHYSTAGHHGGLWRFWIMNKKGFYYHMIFIGVPFSKYSSYKPADLEPYRTSPPGETPHQLAPSSSSTSSSSSASSSASSSGAPAVGQQHPAPEQQPAPSPSPTPTVGQLVKATPTAARRVAPSVR